jgi:pimeloyl-ACP methyl ester carboxylesterase
MNSLAPPPGVTAREVLLPWPGTAGLATYVQEAGSGEPAFLLLHGFTLSTTTWHDVFGGFASLGRTVAYDRVPFGRSAKLAAGQWRGPNPYTPEATLGQLFALMDAVGLERAVLVGSSAGGLLAARAALARPDRVSGVILDCAAVLTLPSERGAWLLRRRFPGLTLARVFGDNGWVLRRSFRDPARITPERVARTRVAMAQPGWDLALWEFMKASTKQPDIAADLGRLVQPVLVIGGGADRVVPPADNPRLAGLLPRAELVMLADAGHLPHEEQPEAFMAAVRDWVCNQVPVFTY